MQNVTTIDLKRDCAATQIPSGTPVTLPAGTTVDITQTLGGSYTVRPISGGLFRIASSDADALGIEALSLKDQAPTSTVPAGPVEEQSVWDTLRTCYDPEIPVN